MKIAPSTTPCIVIALACRRARSLKRLRRKEFYREVSISATNVFVRIVGDVHALFGAVMARDAAWDGTRCSPPLESGSECWSCGRRAASA